MRSKQQGRATARPHESGRTLPTNAPKSIKETALCSTRVGSEPPGDEQGVGAADGSEAVSKAMRADSIDCHTHQGCSDHHPQAIKHDEGCIGRGQRAARKMRSKVGKADGVDAANHTPSDES